MLLENSLYTNQAERDALVKDKKRVMDALCFSLLGFLGCYQLAQNRAALKTYQTTEGKLQLNSIGDTNHDVSLSVKLAEEAQCIPQPAAMAVTKLLYKIKSKQIRGALNEDQIRSLIRLLKIGTHRPDTMVYSVVSQFEDGDIGLAQLAKKLYNLSKIKTFQGVSGEFRVLVLKGQYQELFAKLPVTGNSATVATPAPSSITAPVTVKVAPTPVTPAPAPVPVVPVNPPEFALDGFKNVPDTISISIFRDMLLNVSWTPAVMRDAMVRFCKKNKINITCPPGSIQSVSMTTLRKFMTERFTAQDFNWIGQVPKETPKWMIAMEQVSYAPSWLLYLYAYHHARTNLLEGKWTEFLAIMDKFKWKVGALGNQYNISDNNLEFLSTLISPKNFWGYTASHLSNMVIDTLNRVCLHIRNASGTNSASTKVELPLGPELWSILFGFNRYSAVGDWATSLLCGKYNKQMDRASLFVKAFDLGDSNISVKQAASGGTLVVTAKLEQFKGNEHTAIDILNRIGTVKLVDIADTFATMTRDAVLINKKNDQYAGYFSTVATTCFDSFGNTDLINTEKFVDWTVEALHNGTLVWDNTFLALPTGGDATSDSAVNHCWNVFEAYCEKYPPTFKTWFRLYPWYPKVEADLKDSSFYVDMMAIFNKYAKHYTANDINVTITQGTGYSSQMAFRHMATAVEKGLFKMPEVNMEVWKQILLWNPSDAGDIRLLSILCDWSEDTANLMWAQPMGAGSRSVMVKKYKAIRDSLQNTWIQRWNQTLSLGRWTEAFRDLLKTYYIKDMTEDQILPEMMKLIKVCISHLGDTPHVDYRDFASGAPLPAWLDGPVKEALINTIHATTNMTTVTNASKLLDKDGFNKYVESKSMQEFADSIVVDSYTNATNLCDILDKISKKPTDYNINVLLRFAYALHKNVTTMKGVISKQYVDSAYESVCETLNTLMSLGMDKEVDQVYDALSFTPDLRNKIVDWFRKAGQLKNALNSVKDDAIHALQEVDQKRMNQLMKYNNIKFPRLTKNKDTKLSDIVKSSSTFDLEELKITEDTLDEKAMKRRTAEYDAFNKYRHGNIGLRFLKSFNVDIPVQKAANAVFDAAHPTSERMDPCFHGTGSVAATFVLRYGFAVVAKSDSSVVGRMLGNGIYFSNVLDKAGQYIGDAGYSRGLGTKGYIMQMKANLGTYGVDYKSAISGVISPEWCVFNPNDQLNIYKAHFVEVVTKSTVDQIKAEVNLNENFFKVEQFKQHLNEDLQTPTGKGCVSYTFMDGNIPISEHMAIDFEDFDATAYGPHVTVEPSGLGPVVYIRVDDSDVNDIFAVRYTIQFMSQNENLQRFLNLLTPTTEVK